MNSCNFAQAYISPTILLARLCTYEKWRLSQVNQRGR